MDIKLYKFLNILQTSLFNSVENVKINFQASNKKTII
jgi:hypothetical protein